jgi:hypothetical protein
MNLDYSVFSFAAIVEQNGLFGILNGGLEWLTAKSWPAAVQSLALLARFSFAPNECGKEYPCVVRVVSPAGAMLTPDLVVVLRPGVRARNPELNSSFVAVYRYPDFSFPMPGFYRFCFFIDDKQVGEAKLEAVQAEA